MFILDSNHGFKFFGYMYLGKLLNIAIEVTVSLSTLFFIKTLICYRLLDNIFGIFAGLLSFYLSLQEKRRNEILILTRRKRERM